MNCEQANQIDLVDYLYLLGYQAQKIRSQDYWYLSPLREEKKASFKVNRKKNVWYDHGFGKGRNVIEFAVQFFNCNVSEALLKISSSHQQKNTCILLQKHRFPTIKNLFINATNESVETGTFIHLEQITQIFHYYW